MWTQRDLERVEARQRATELAEMRRTNRGLWGSAVVVVLPLIAYRAVFLSSVFALHRVADDDPRTRTLVAMFNSEEGAEINKGNCEAVLAAMQQQKPAYKVRYACDRGKW
jgi:hypothetical protein